MFIYNINISFSYSNYLPTIEVGGYSDYFSPKTGVIDGTGTTLTTTTVPVPLKIQSYIIF